MERLFGERLISSRKVFEGKLLSVRVDQVECANGARASREIVVHPGAIAVVPLLPDNRVVMIRQYRHAAGKVLYELPAGTLEPGESPEECAKRELVEEIGYSPGSLKLLFYAFLAPGYSMEIIHLFLATELQEVSHFQADLDESIEPFILPLEEAVALVRRGEVQNAAAVCGLLATAYWRVK